MRNKKEAGIACFLLRFRENQRITGRRGPLSFLRYPDMVGTKEKNFMMPIIYSLFAYALTAAISGAVFSTATSPQNPSGTSNASSSAPS